VSLQLTKPVSLKLGAQVHGSPCFLPRPDNAAIRADRTLTFAVRMAF
jgi:hypothetical protein